jgi:hypothetical protein
MTSVDEQILRAAKEIVVKFIEVGRVSPNSFPESFREIYDAVHGAVKEKLPPSEEKLPAKKA